MAIQAIYVDGTIYPINRKYCDNFHTHLLCPFCAKVWAELTVEKPIRHIARIAFCENCNEYDSILTSGSVLDNYLCNLWLDRDLLNLLPPVLLKREFDLALKSVEKSQCQNPPQQMNNPYSPELTY